MTRFSRKAGDEVPLKHADEGQRRTKPADCGPRSPKEIEAIYSRGKVPDGIRSGTTHEHQKNQFTEDKHDKNYDNDCKGWVRSQDEDSTLNRPGGFDHFPKRDGAGGGRCTASGQDIKASPFSAASHATRDENDWNPTYTLNKKR